MKGQALCPTVCLARGHCSKNTKRIRNEKYFASPNWKVQLKERSYCESPAHGKRKSVRCAQRKPALTQCLSRRREAHMPRCGPRLLATAPRLVMRTSSRPIILASRRQVPVTPHVPERYPALNRDGGMLGHVCPEGLSSRRLGASGNLVLLGRKGQRPASPMPVNTVAACPQRGPQDR